MKLRIVPASRGFHWMRQGFQVLKRQPLGFMGLVGMLIGGALLLASLPVLGPLVVLGAANLTYGESRYWQVTGSQVTTDPAIPSFNFEMVAGADYTMDLSKPLGARITGLTVNGVPVRDGDSFTIALSNYRAAGAGGYTMLRGAPLMHDKQLEIRQLLIDEVMARKTLQPSDYFTRNWALTPDALQQAAAAASVHERPFDAIRPLNHFP